MKFLLGMQRCQSSALLLLLSSVPVSFGSGIRHEASNVAVVSPPTLPHSEATASVKGFPQGNHFVRLDLKTKSQAQQRHLQATPEEEEGNPQVVDALYQGYGEHYVDLWCGMPPQRQTLIVGTGSSGTAFPCSQCHDCGSTYHTDRAFNEQASNSYHQLTCDECALGRCSTTDPSRVGTCNFGMSYAEGSSWRAVEAKDHCYIGGLHDRPTFDDGVPDDLDPEHASAFGFSVNFGCQTSITGLFVTQLADGILGMSNSPHSFWRQMYDAQKIQNEIFSLCYVRQNHALRNGTQAGAMTLGGSDDRLHLNPMVFTSKEDTWAEFYDMYLRKIYLREGDGSLSMNATRDDLKIIQLDIDASVLNKGPVFIESGTTDTYFTSALAAPFSVAWNQLVSWPYDNKWYSMTYEEMSKLPTIIIQFQGSQELNEKVGDPNTVPNLAGDLDPQNPYDVVVAVPPQHYMEKSDSSENRYIPRFYMGDPVWGGSTIGANFIMGHDVMFDMKNRRIGWAESNCNYDHLVEAAGYGKEKQTPPNPAPAASATQAATPATPTPAATKQAAGNTPKASNTAEEPENSKGGLCTSSFCQFGGLIVVVSLVVGVMVQRRIGSGRVEYSSMSSSKGSNAELELQVAYRETELA